MKDLAGDFARRLRVVLSGHEMKPLGAGEVARIAISQAVIHAVGLFVVPLSLIAVVPFGWVFAFAQSATALADDGVEGFPRFSTKLVRHSALWPHQNHALVLVLVRVRCGGVSQLDERLPGLAFPGQNLVRDREHLFPKRVQFVEHDLFCRHVRVDLPGGGSAGEGGLLAALFLRRFTEIGRGRAAGTEAAGRMAQGSAGRIAAICVLVLAATTPIAAGLINTPLQRGVNERLGMPSLRQPRFQGFGAALADGSAGLQAISPRRARRRWPNASALGSAPSKDKSRPRWQRAPRKAHRSSAARRPGLKPWTACRQRNWTRRSGKPSRNENMRGACPATKRRQKPAEQSMLSRFFEKIGDMLQRGAQGGGPLAGKLLARSFPAADQHQTGVFGLQLGGNPPSRWPIC